MNQVERWFGEITEKRIRRGSFTIVPEQGMGRCGFRTCGSRIFGGSILSRIRFYFLSGFTSR
ncbi:MAG: hypothetical protein WKF37_05150, partial [Bryobacteraceae bacterium]